MIPFSAGNFFGVQIFTHFMDRLVSAKIKTMDMVTNCKKVSHVLELRSIESTKIKNALNKKDYEAIPQKFAPVKICCYMLIRPTSLCRDDN